MSRKSWQLDRRTFLRGVGVSCLLPWLEAMEAPRLPKSAAAPRRVCFVYFPNGCSLPERDDEKNADWRWFPDCEGEDFRFTEVLAPLEPFREDLAIYGGLSHPKSRKLLGHLAGDTWLTAGDLRGDRYKNSVSVDQVAARTLKKHTRFPSLVLSADGGVGYKSRVSTLSFDENGRPIPSENVQRRIFERYFASSREGLTAERRKSLGRGRKIVDLVLAESRDLKRRLGRDDQERMDDFLTSLDEVEQQIRRNERWLATPVGPFESDHLELDAKAKVDPKSYIRTMYDLLALAFRLDLTRVATYMLAREDGLGIGESWPSKAVGIKRGHHTISHDTHQGHFEQWGRYDRWYAEQFAHFLERLRAAKDEHGSVLDRTIVVYGSACSTTHNARNYPMAVAGGRELGVRLGHYRHYGADEAARAKKAGAKHFVETDRPCSDLYLSILQALRVPAATFADGHEPLAEFMKA